MRYFCKIILLFLFLSPFLSAQEVLRVRILALSDIHAVLSPEVKYHLIDLARDLKALRGENALVIDCGDLIQGSFAGAATRGKMVVDAVNLAGVDVWVPGNHDFEFGASILSERMKEFQGAVLGANWRFTGASGLKNPEAFRVFRLGKVSVAVIGLTEAQERFRVLPGFPAEFDKTEEEALTRTLAEVHRFDVDVIVLARHGSLYFRGGNLWKLLKKFPEIDLVLGGHTHEAHPGARVGRSFFVQSPDRLESLAEVTIDVDAKTRRVLRIVSELRPLTRSASPSSPDMPDLSNLEKKMEKLAAEGKKLLPGAPFRGIPGEWSVAAMERSVPGGVAMFGAEAIQSRQASFRTLEELYQLFPYENEICTIRVSAEELATILAEQRRIGKNRRIELFHSPLPTTGEVLLVTTDYILSGAGGIAPETRAIAEKNRRSLRALSIPLRDGVLAFILNKPR